MNLSPTITRHLGRSELFLKQHGPSILTGVGVAGFVATTVLVGRAVLKAKPEMDKLKEEGDVIAAVAVSDIYTEKKKTQEIGTHYIKGWMHISRHFILPTAVGTTSVVCILSAHGLMLRREASLLAAYSILDAGFKAYRSRVREELGEERELEFYRGVRKVESVDDEGKPCIIDDFDISKHLPSPYAKLFDETNKHWKKTGEYNLFFLRSIQQWANDRLNAYGHIFLNEVYDELGIDRTQAGQSVGWKKDGSGDGFVDFGLYDIGSPSAMAFINGQEASVMLDFNVDGPIRI